MSVICRVTWCIFVHHSPYHMNEFDIACIKLWTFFCKFYMLSIKFNYAAPLCCSICSRDVFDPVKCKARGFFTTAFHCYLLISHSVFYSVSHHRSFHPHYRHEQSHRVHSKVLQVGGFLLPLSLLKYFLSRANWILTE